jgi:hypothetical protein
LRGDFINAGRVSSSLGYGLVVADVLRYDDGLFATSSPRPSGVVKSSDFMDL